MCTYETEIIIENCILHYGVALGDFELRLCYRKRSSNFHCCNNVNVCNLFIYECTCMDKRKKS